MKGNIVLCGFMGCGKTTVGKKLSKILNREFCDMDRYIEKREGMAIAQIFDKYGEEGFRQREAQAVKEISRKGNMVVASGGGTVLFPQNVQAFHRGGGVLVLLDTPLASLQQRLKNDRKRPLIQKPDRNRVIRELYEERIPLYRAAADVTVNGGAPAWVVARKLAALDL